MKKIAFISFIVFIMFTGACSSENKTQAEKQTTSAELNDKVPVISPNNNPLSYKMDKDVKVFNLTAEEVVREVSKGIKVKAWGYNGITPGPTIVARKGDRVRFHVTNKLNVPTSIHWHGLVIPNKMDGVPGLQNSPKIEPGKSFDYEFTLKQTGTYMYHSHVNPSQQEMMGLDGMLVVLPEKGHEIDGYNVDRDYTLLLQEWQLEGNMTEDDMNQKMKDETSMNDSMKMEENTTNQQSARRKMFGEGQVPAGTYEVNPEGMMWNVFTFNGVQFPTTTPMKVKKGETVLIRLGNLSMQNHPIHFHGHEFTVAGKDGQAFSKNQQYEANTIDVAPGETYDLIFKANNPGTWVFHCHLPHHTAGQDGGEGGMMTSIHYDGTTWPPGYTDAQKKAAK